MENRDKTWMNYELYIIHEENKKQLEQIWWDEVFYNQSIGHVRIEDNKVKITRISPYE